VHAGSRREVTRPHPVAVFLIVVLSGLALSIALSIGLGFLATHVVEPTWGSGERFDEWLAPSYGPFLLGLVAVGLIAFGVYSLSDARYRRI
jgi:hypothetical protein